MACCCGGCTFCVYLCDVCGGSVAGQTVSLSLGGVVIDTQTTDSLGHCCFTISASGTYTVSAVVGGVTFSASRTVALPCPQAKIILPLSDALLSVTPIGCNGLDLPGTLIAVSPGTIIGSATYSGSPVLACVPPGASITVTATPPSARFDTTVKTVAGPAACGTKGIQIDLNVASGYVCFCGSGIDCRYPVSTTLHITEDRYLSTIAVSYNATLGYWVGQDSVFYPGCAFPYFAPADCEPANFVLQWSVGAPTGGRTDCGCNVIANNEWNHDAVGYDRFECPGANPAHAMRNAGISPRRACASTCPYPEGADGWVIDQCPETGAFMGSGRIILRTSTGVPNWIWGGGVCAADFGITCGGLSFLYTTVGFTFSE